MKIKIKRIDKDLPLPKRVPEGAAAFDLYARKDMEIESNTFGLIPMNIIVSTPPGWAFIVIPRSSTPAKKGLLTPHGVGLVDPYYHGPDDEVYLQVYNFTNKKTLISRGDRIGQGFFIKVEDIEWEEIEEIKNENRGGFGSTGH